MDFQLPKRYFYFDEYSVRSFYEQLNGRVPIESTESSIRNHSVGIATRIGLSNIIKAIFPVDPSIEANVKKGRQKGNEEKAIITPVGLLDMIEEKLTKEKASFFSKIFLEASVYCNENGNALFNSELQLDIVQYSLANKNPIDEINRDKAILFKYDHLRHYTESDSYFKYPQRDMFMSASLAKFVPPRDHFSTRCHEGIYFEQYSGKMVRLTVFGLLCKMQNGYQIKPFAISY